MWPFKPDLRCADLIAMESRVKFLGCVALDLFFGLIRPLAVVESTGLI